MISLRPICRPPPEAGEDERGERGIEHAEKNIPRAVTDLFAGAPLKKWEVGRDRFPAEQEEEHDQRETPARPAKCVCIFRSQMRPDAANEPDDQGQTNKATECQDDFSFRRRKFHGAILIARRELAIRRK